MSKGYGHYRNWIYARYDLLGNVIHETYARLDEVTNDNNLAYVGDWQQNGSYFKNDLVSYEDKTYKVIQDVSGSLVPPSEDEEHYVEFNSEIVSFITLTSASGTLNANQMRYILASKNTSLVYYDRVYQQVGTANGSTNFVSFETIDNENYIYVITVASNGSYTRTSNRIVKEEEVATDLGINEPNNLVYLVRGETKLGNGAAFKTINGVSIIGSGNIIVGESGTIAIDDTLSLTSENPVQNKVITAELNTKAVLGAFNGGGTGVDYADLANNLIASKGLEVESYFTFEKTGGEQASAIDNGNATLKNLYGKTEKSENLLVIADVPETTRNGVTYKVKNGVITLNGTATADFNLVFTSTLNLPLNASSYYLSLMTNWVQTGGFYIGTTEWSTLIEVTVGRSAWSGTLQNSVICNYVRAFIGNGQVFSNLVLRPMLVQGSSAPTEWSQGYEGLKHTHITGLKSTGINLWDEVVEQGSIDVNTGQNITSTLLRSKNYIRVNANTTYYMKWAYRVFFYDINNNYISYVNLADATGAGKTFTTPAICSFVRFNLVSEYGTTYNHDICINFSNANINGNHYPYEEDTLAIDFEGNGVGTASDEINVEEGKKYQRLKQDNNMGGLNWGGSNGSFYARVSDMLVESSRGTNVICPKYNADTSSSHSFAHIFTESGYLNVIDDTYQDLASFISAMTNIPIVYPLATPIVTDVEIPKDTIKVWNGGSMEALGTEIPVGTKIFYQKNIKSFVEAFGEAIDWNPDRIERLAKLSITPEYVNISLNPAQENAYAVAQVYNATFTIVISTALTGTADSSITFQDSEIDLSSFETQPAESIYDMDGKKVSEEPTTEDCNIASFVGRSYNGIVLWSLLHSGVNKVKVHFEQAIPLDSEGNGKLDCRASLIL